MGLFGKLFDTKYCDVCGAEISFMGNKKLMDGNCCKQCTEKFSPYFTNRKHSTVEEIKYQIRCREENLKKLQSFSATKIIGTTTKILIDEEKMQFVIQPPNIKPNTYLDVLDCDCILDCIIDINESLEEIKYEDSNDEIKSFNPPCFAHAYDFYIEIRVNVPYINVIRFKLNSKKIDNNAKTLIHMQGGLLSHFTDALMPNKSYGGKTSNADEVRASTEYLKFDQLSKEIKDTLIGYKEAFMIHRNAENNKIKCPWCDCMVLKSGIGNCPRCGGVLD